MSGVQLPTAQEAQSKRRHQSRRDAGAGTAAFGQSPSHCLHPQLRCVRQAAGKARPEGGRIPTPRRDTRHLLRMGPQPVLDRGLPRGPYASATSACARLTVRSTKLVLTSATSACASSLSSKKREKCSRSRTSTCSR